MRSPLAVLLGALILTACGPQRVIVVARTRASFDPAACESVCASELRAGEKIVNCAMANVPPTLQERFTDLHEYAVTCELE